MRRITEARSEYLDAMFGDTYIDDVKLTDIDEAESLHKMMIKSIEQLARDIIALRNLEPKLVNYDYEVIDNLYISIG